MDQELVGVGIVYGVMCLTCICLFAVLIYALIIARMWHFRKPRKEE